MAMKYFNEMKIREIKKFHGTIKPRVHEKKKINNFFWKTIYFKNLFKTRKQKKKNQLKLYIVDLTQEFLQRNKTH